MCTGFGEQEKTREWVQLREREGEWEMKSEWEGVIISRNYLEIHNLDAGKIKSSLEFIYREATYKK